MLIKARLRGRSRMSGMPIIKRTPASSTASCSAVSGKADMKAPVLQAMTAPTMGAFHATGMKQTSTQREKLSGWAWPRAMAAAQRPAPRVASEPVAAEEVGQRAAYPEAPRGRRHKGRQYAKRLRHAELHDAEGYRREQHGQRAVGGADDGGEGEIFHC